MSTFAADLWNRAAREEAEVLRAHKARRYPAPTLDAEDDDYDFVVESLDRWADRAVRDPSWREAKRR